MGTFIMYMHFYNHLSTNWPAMICTFGTSIFGIRQDSHLEWELAHLDNPSIKASPHLALERSSKSVS